MAQKFNGSVEILGEVIANKVTSSGNVSAGSITTSGNVSTNSITANSATTKSLSVTETLNIQFTDSNGAINYIGKNIGTLSISTGTHIFTNCRGTISYSGTSAKVYIVNSPNLAVNSKTTSNWQNIWIDGVASAPDESTTMWQDGTMIKKGGIYSQVATGVTISTIFSAPAFISVPKVYLTCNADEYSVWSTISVTVTSFTCKRQVLAYNQIYLAIGRWK